MASQITVFPFYLVPDQSTCTAQEVGICQKFTAH